MLGARWSWPLAPFSCNVSKKPGGFLEASSHNDCWAWRCQTRRLRRNNALYALLLAECSVVPGNKCFIEARATLHSSSYQYQLLFEVREFLAQFCACLNHLCQSNMNLQLERCHKYVNKL